MTKATRRFSVMVRHSMCSVALLVAAFAGSGWAAAGDRDLAGGILNDSSFTPIFQAMVRYFPDDAAKLEAELRSKAAQLGVDDQEIIPTESVEALSATTSRSFEKFFDRHGPDAYHAPDLDVRAVLQSRIQAIKFYEGKGNQCNIALIYGMHADELDPLPNDLVQRGSLANFVAMYAGSKAETKRPRLKVYTAELRAKIFQGLDAEEEALISTPSISNPKTCSANIKLFENIWRATGHDAELYRAETLLLFMTR